MREEASRGILAEIRTAARLPQLDVRAVHLPDTRVGPAAAALLRYVGRGAPRR